MGGPRSQATRAEVLAGWATDVPFKAFAAQLGMSPNTLRGIWQGAFGAQAFAERGKRLQALGAASWVPSGLPRTYGQTSIPCTVCAVPIAMQTNQAARIDRSSFVCDGCRCDRTCPVCDLPVDGVRGLSMHFRHRQTAGDAAHIAHADTDPWEGKVAGQDYVTCLECGHRSASLGRHLKALHGITAAQYHAKHVGALVWSAKASAAHREAVTAGRQSVAYAGAKAVSCPSCGVGWDASKFLGTLHDHRCLACQEREDFETEQARWIGKTEPEDYVECRECGYRTEENLNSHIQGAHPMLTSGGYADLYPEAPINSIGSGTRTSGAKLRANLTEADLDPFKDQKGHVQVALAADILGLSGNTILRYCKQLKIPTRNRLAFQKRVLDAVSTVLGLPYDWEWSTPQIANPETGYKLFFDGHFGPHKLLVEAHGAQHFRFIPLWHRTQEYFDQMVRRDAVKLRGALALGYRVLVIRYDEPYADLGYLRSRLAQLGLVP